jgi:hypothetical protein
MDEVIAYIEESTLRRQLDYGIDGVVVKVSPLWLWPELGVVGEREPRYAIAYKFPPDLAITRLLAIELNVGRTGSLNPYARLEPVEIGGVMVKLATLHNFEDIARKDLRVGDMVVVKRAGEVIPQVVGAGRRAAHRARAAVRAAEHCPSCGTPVERPAGEVMLYCPNSSCPDRIYWGLVHFVSQDAMDIRGLGERTAAQLLEKRDSSRDFADLYSPDARRTCCSWRASARCPRATCCGDRRRRAAAAVPAAVRARASATSGSMRRRPRPRVRQHGRDHARRRSRCVRRRARHWPHHGGGAGHVPGRAAQPRAGRAAARGRCHMTEPVERAEHSTLAGRTFVITGTHA